VIQNRT